jgi:hypothetical protein
MSEKISSLTKEQEALIPAYLEKYKEIGLSTRVTNVSKAEDAIRRAYKYLKFKDPVIVWEPNPFQGAEKAAKLLKGSDDVTKQEISDQASKASYGSFEAYWVSFYAYIDEQLPVKKDELITIVKDIVDECGVYWTFEDVVVVTPKPAQIHMVNGKLHNENGKALVYPDGSGIYALNGTRYATLAELKLATIMGSDEEQKAV